MKGIIVDVVQIHLSRGNLLTFPLLCIIPVASSVLIIGPLQLTMVLKTNKTNYSTENCSVAII